MLRVTGWCCNSGIFLVLGGEGTLPVYGYVILPDKPGHGGIVGLCPFMVTGIQHNEVLLNVCTLPSSGHS